MGRKPSAAAWRGSTRTASGRPTARPTPRGGLQDDHVQALVLGADGALWAGTAGGVWRGSTKTATGRPTAIPAPRAVCRTITSQALALGADGTLWVGTLSGGLARLDKDGHWQTYSKASTQGGLPDDRRLGVGARRGRHAVGRHRGGGLGNFNRPSGRTVRIVEVIGKIGEVAQADQTIAVTAFDDSYLTQPGMFHYIWRLSEIGPFNTSMPGPEIKTRSSVYRAVFPHDGAYQLRVVAVDRYGNRSDPKDINFKVTLPKPKTLWDTLVAAWPILSCRGDRSLSTLASLRCCGWHTVAHGLSPYFLTPYGRAG